MNTYRYSANVDYTDIETGTTRSILVFLISNVPLSDVEAHDFLTERAAMIVGDYKVQKYGIVDPELLLYSIEHIEEEILP